MPVAEGPQRVLSLLLLPMFVAPVIVGLLGRFLTDSTFGLYAWGCANLAYNGDILGARTSAFAAVTLMDVWEWTPLIALIVLAGLTSVPAGAGGGALDGAGLLARLRHIVLPMIAGVILVALLIRSMDAIRYFDIIWNTTNGGPADATKTARPALRDRLPLLRLRLRRGHRSVDAGRHDLSWPAVHDSPRAEGAGR